jgi:acetolactate synthase I/III small subunit
MGAFLLPGAGRMSRQSPGLRSHMKQKGRGSKVRRTWSALVENEPGVLTRIAGLFGRRAFNIQSLSVAEAERPNHSRLTIVARGSQPTLEQIEKQLNNLINVVQVTSLEGRNAVERELCLIKVMADAHTRPVIAQIVQMLNAHVVDVGPRALVIEVTGEPDRLEAVLEMFAPFGICQVARSGAVGLERSMASALSPAAEATQYGNNLLNARAGG